MWSLLRTGRWIGFTAVVIAAIIAFGALSAWQWTRAEERRTERLALTTQVEAAPLPLSASDTTAPDYAHVSLRGFFVEGSDRLVRSKPQGGGNGFWVISALEPEAFPGVYTWIVRGWMASQSAATASVSIPGAPAGIQTIEGFLRTFENIGPTPADLPDGQISAVDLEQLPRLEGTVFPRWIQSASNDGSLEPVLLPEVDDSRNISYAVQWLLFAGVALTGWFFFLRREAREDAAVQESESAN